jgi:hypothetical protein
MHVSPFNRDQDRHQLAATALLYKASNGSPRDKAMNSAPRRARHAVGGFRRAPGALAAGAAPAPTPLSDLAHGWADADDIIAVARVRHRVSRMARLCATKRASFCLLRGEWCKWKPKWKWQRRWKRNSLYLGSV